MKKFYLPVRAVILSALFLSHLYLYSNTRRIEKVQLSFAAVLAAEDSANESITQVQKPAAKEKNSEKKEAAQDLASNN
jgi:hypothetical protein